MAKLVIFLDDKVLKEVVLNKDRVSLGRRPHNDVVIDNLAVSGEHAVLLREGDPAGQAVRNLVTRALGVDPAMEPEIASHPLLSGDLLLLCSDGLSDMLDDARIEALLNEYHGAVEAAARRLVQEANVAGGRDNISVILIQFNHAL